MPAKKAKASEAFELKIKVEPCFAAPLNGIAVSGVFYLHKSK